MQIPHRFSPKFNPLLPELGTADEREEPAKIVETIPEPTTIPECEVKEETKIKTQSDLVL